MVVANGMWASLLHGMCDLSRPGIEPVSPALAGGFLTNGPAEKPQSMDFYNLFTIFKIQLYKSCCTSILCTLRKHAKSLEF